MTGEVLARSPQAEDHGVPNAERSGAMNQLVQARGQPKMSPRARELARRTRIAGRLGVNQAASVSVRQVSLA